MKKKIVAILIASTLTLTSVTPVAYAEDVIVSDEKNNREEEREKEDIKKDDEAILEKTKSELSEKVEDEKQQVAEYVYSEKTLEDDSASQQSDVAVVASGQNGTCLWTLYEDGLLTLGGGTWGGGYPGWWTLHRTKIKTVKIIDDIDISPTNSYGFSNMFSDCTNLVSVEGLEHLATQNSTAFYGMFYGCESLQTIDLSSFDTSNSVEFTRMFSGCSNLENIDVSQFDTSKALYLNEMFTGCRKVTELNVSSFNTSKSTTFSKMFSGCYSLKKLDISQFDTSNSKNFSQMFSGLSKVEHIDTSGFNTKNATDMSFMFQNMQSISELDVSSFNTSNVTNMEYMFSGMTNLVKINVTGFNVENVKKFNSCFSGLTSIEKLDLSNFVTTGIGPQGNEYVFRNLPNLKELNIENWEIYKTDAAYKFFENTLPEKITVGQNFRFTNSMGLSEVPSGSTWVDKDDNLIFRSNNLLDFHNNNALTNTYRIEKLYTLKFDTMGGTSVQSQQNIYGKTWNIPEVPEKNGFIFEYWSSDKDGKEPFNFSSTINDSITLYAQYSPAYTVTIPATVNLNEENRVAVSAGNFQDDKQLIVSTSDTLILKNTYDSTILIQKNITKEKNLEEGKVLEINGVGKFKNTLSIQEPTEKEAAGKYKGVLDFIIDFN